MPTVINIIKNVAPKNVKRKNGKKKKHQRWQLWQQLLARPPSFSLLLRFVCLLGAVSSVPRFPF